MNTMDKKMVIIMADDDPDDFVLVREALQDTAYGKHLHQCHDGEQLLDYLLQQKKYRDPEQYPPPVLILLDLNMPKISGRQALARIKGTVALRHIPVIILSTSIEAEDMEYCFRLGANAYVQKSHSFDLLGANLKEAVEPLLEKEISPETGKMDQTRPDRSGEKAVPRQNFFPGGGQ